nr:PEPxxWA-CTERM sorting domain-containing protein [uncultured Sphingomonas sp.]
MSRGILVSLATAAAIFMSDPARAAEIAFSGGTSGSAVVGADATCTPIPFRGTISGAAGTSTFGDFNYSHSVCTQGAAGGPIVGAFTIDFGVDQFTGTLLGASQPSGTVNLSSLLINYSITGGTGRFLGATGAFTGLGTANTSTRPSIVTLTFSAVPEPGSWAMMLIGFGGVGLAMRRNRLRRRACLMQLG